MSDLHDERAFALELVRACAAVALEYQRGGTRILRVRNKPWGGGPVTAADEDLDQRIVSGIGGAFPRDAIVAEESHDDDAVLDGAAPQWVSNRRCWFVDPIDGTREFANGTSGWTVQVGLCVDGEPVLGVVAEPRLERISWAMLDRAGTPAARWVGATQVGESEAVPLRCAQRAFDELLLIGGTIYPLSRQNAIRRVLGISSGRAKAVGSVGVRMASVARGAADTYVQAPGKTKMWDTCAPQALVLAAGGRVTDLRGEPLRFNAPPVQHPHGVIACAAQHHAQILERLHDLVPAWLPAGE